MPIFAGSRSRRSTSDARQSPTPAPSKTSRIRAALAVNRERSLKVMKAGSSLDENSLPRAASLSSLNRLGLSPHSGCRFVATPSKLGSGAYGAVLLGKECFTSQPVAIKFIPDGRMRNSSLEREVAMLRRLSEANNPALIRFLAHVRPSEAKAGEIVAEGREAELPLTKPIGQCHALVMEVARGGELFDHVVQADGLHERDAAPLFAQLCDAVRSAHRLGIAHRDLKLENVLLVDKPAAPSRSSRAPRASSADEPQRLKLIDWGLAHQHALHADGRIVPEALHSRCGSRSYMAPEVTNREVSANVGYDGFAADVYSLGVCLFAIHLAFFPFEQALPAQDWRAQAVLEAQERGESTIRTILAFYPSKGFSLSPSLVALLDSMLMFDPARRASLEDVLASPWLQPHVAALRARHLAELADAAPLRLAATERNRTGSSASTCSTASNLTLDERQHHESHAGGLYPHHAAATRLGRQDSTASTAHSICSSIATDSNAASLANSRVVTPTRRAQPAQQPWATHPVTVDNAHASAHATAHATAHASTHATAHASAHAQPWSRAPSRPPSPLPAARVAARLLVGDPAAAAAPAPPSPEYYPPVQRGESIYAPDYRPNRPTNVPPASVEVVIAGGSRAGQHHLAQQSLKEPSRRSDEQTDEGGCAPRANYLASIFSKSCKVSRSGSPRWPERSGAPSAGAAA